MEKRTWLKKLKPSQKGAIIGVIWGIISSSYLIYLAEYHFYLYLGFFDNFLYVFLTLPGVIAIFIAGFFIVGSLVLVIWSLVFILAFILSLFIGAGLGYIFGRCYSIMIGR